MKHFFVTLLACLLAFVLLSVGVYTHDEYKKKVKKRKELKKARLDSLVKTSKRSKKKEP